jgi:L-2-hydroxyglutarate oxidase
MSRVVVVGAGIVGLATAARLAARGDEVVVLEKEEGLARHQTGRNSGVIHSGVYYAVGSLKARMAVAGAASMAQFAQERGIPYAGCGKLVVAVTEEELPGLTRLAERAVVNGVPARLVSPEEAREHEPHARCVRALWVESTGIIDYRAVSAVLADDVKSAGGEVRFGESFVTSTGSGRGVQVRTSRNSIQADGLVACAGLYADRVALSCGLDPGVRIVPFRGEYFELVPELDDLVRGLIYPVPDPRFPFLGVHLTRMVRGGVHAGPNAVLALAREGYTWRTVDVPELGESLRWPGLWRLAAHNLRPGAAEVGRSISRKAFARALSRLVPGIKARHLVPGPSGVRAQAVTRQGALVDDFLIREASAQVHVVNAPSPAATASLEIAKHIVERLDAVRP